MILHTPWGPPQHQREIAAGITELSCSGHGGFHLSADRVGEMPEGLRGIVTWAGNDAEGGRWFEEDCDYRLVVLSFPQLFTPYEVWKALQGYEGDRHDTFQWEAQCRYARQRGEEPPPRPQPPADPFRGEARDAVERIAAEFFKQHKDAWRRVGSGCGPGMNRGIYVLYRQMSTDEPAKRYLTREEADAYYDLPSVVPELPGSPEPTANAAHETISSGALAH